MECNQSNRRHCWPQHKVVAVQVRDNGKLFFFSLLQRDALVNWDRMQCIWDRSVLCNRHHLLLATSYAWAFVLQHFFSLNSKYIEEVFGMGILLLVHFFFNNIIFFPLALHVERSASFRFSNFMDMHFVFVYFHFIRPTKKTIIIILILYWLRVGVQRWIC